MNLSSAPAWTFPGRKISNSCELLPGPGQYSPSISKYEKSPCYRIGTSNRSTFAYSSTPGPGAYNPNNLKFDNTPSFSYGKGTRISARQAQTPGPGSYLTKPIFATIGGKIGTSNRDSFAANSLAPGPGAYSPASRAIEGPKYTMSSRRPLTAGAALPGPGAYNVVFNDITTRDKSPSYRIGSAERRPMTSPDKIPGPGNYSIGSSLQGPKWGFGTSNRSPNKRDNSPGPGSYQYTNKLNETGFTIQGRYKPTSSFLTPGPGTYTVQSPVKGTAWSMGRAVRNSFDGKLSTPGPGSYAAPSSLSKNAAVFLSASRKSISQQNFVPGPGQYSVSFSQASPAYSIGSRPGTQKKDSVPGPGQYNPPQASAFYSPSKIGNGWTFTRDPRSKELKGFGPGPGQYQLSSTIGNLPAYARRSR